MRGSSLVRAIALLAVVVATVSCDAITGGGGSFTLTLSDTTLNLGQGKTDTVVITLGRSSYSKPIALSVDGVPAGVTANLLAQTVPGNSSITGMEVIVSPTATPATTKLTIHATGAGVSERTASFDIAIGVTGSFSMSSDGFPLTAAQGGGGVGTVLVTRSGGHADNVTLAATGLPSGVTASFASSPTTAGSSPVTFVAAAGAVPGSYNVTITGTAAGISPQSVPVTINVIAPPATAPLSMGFCNPPDWLAYQNQGSLWQSITPTSGVYTFAATPTLAVAYKFPNGAGSLLLVYYATRDELAARQTDCGTKTITGAIGGALIGQTAIIAMGSADTLATQASPNFTMLRVPNRTLDLVGVKGTISIPANSPWVQANPDKLLVQRGLNPADGSSLGTIDFAAQGFAPATSSLTVANTTAGDSINVESTLITAANTRSLLAAYQTTSTASVVSSVPVPQLTAGDFHELRVETYRSDFSTGKFRLSYLTSISDRTETLLPSLLTPTISVASASPYMRMRIQVPVQAEYPALALTEVCQVNANFSCARTVDVGVSAGFLGATPASVWNLTIPEFGSVSGLDPSWLPNTSFLYTYVEADAGPALPLFGGPPAAGDVLQWAYRNFTPGGLVRAGNSRHGRVPAAHAAQYLRR